MHASELIKHLSVTSGAAGLLVVTEIQGSAPRHHGSKMLVFADGSTMGTIGGGFVEAQAVELAIGHIAEGTSGRFVVEMLGERAEGSAPLCGGTASIAMFIVADRAAYAAASEQLERGKRVVLVFAMQDGGKGNPVAVIGEDGQAVWGPQASVDGVTLSTVIDSGLPAISKDGGLLCDPIVPRDRLLILGGGHVGQSLARIASELDFSVCVGDSRAAYADPARFPPGTETRLGEFDDIVAAYPSGASTYAIVVSPSHSSDLACVRALLRREYRYAGFIGSRRKTRMILEQALADGFPPEQVAALRAPIGADIGAETPAEIAVAILAEIIAVRRDSPSIKAMDADRIRRRS